MRAMMFFAVVLFLGLAIWLSQKYAPSPVSVILVLFFAAALVAYLGWYVHFWNVPWFHGARLPT